MVFSREASHGDNAGLQIYGRLPLHSLYGLYGPRCAVPRKAVKLSLTPNLRHLSVHRAVIKDVTEGLTQCNGIPDSL